MIYTETIGQKMFLMSWFDETESHQTSVKIKLLTLVALSKTVIVVIVYYNLHNFHFAAENCWWVNLDVPDTF